MKNFKTYFFIAMVIAGSCLQGAASDFMSDVDTFRVACKENNTAQALEIYAKYASLGVAIGGKVIPCRVALLSSFNLRRVGEHLIGGTNCLQYAVDHQNMQIIQLILSRREEIKETTDVDVVNYQNETGCTALYIAARKGNKELIALLLQHGADVNMKDSMSMHALFGAVMVDSQEVVTILLDVGADPAIKDSVNKMTAEEAAIWYKKDKALKAFNTYKNNKNK